MLRIVGVVVLCLSAVGCKKPQPGCTKENCRLMVDECRVELANGPPNACYTYKSDGGIEAFRDRLDEYCVTACNGMQAGKLVECVADAGPACQADSSYVPNCETDAQLPEESCEAKCASTKDDCNTRCSGGKACTSCRAAGTPDCSAQCPATDRFTCVDCAEACLPAYFACADACPRAK